MEVIVYILLTSLVFTAVLLLIIKLLERWQNPETVSHSAGTVDDRISRMRFRLRQAQRAVEHTRSDWVDVSARQRLARMLELDIGAIIDIVTSDEDALAIVESFEAAVNALCTVIYATGSGLTPPSIDQRDAAFLDGDWKQHAVLAGWDACVLRALQEHEQEV